jgi:hypothetical protein
MRRSTIARSLVVVLAALAAAGCGTRTVTQTVTVDAAKKAGAGPPRVRWEFGTIHSLVRKGSRYELRFDPALLLSGMTANVAAAEDGAVSPGQPVPNDNYTVDQGHRLLTYLVPAKARVRVLLQGANTVTGSPVTVAQLAQLVAGQKIGRPLFEPLTTGFWIEIDIDTVRELDQQYRP